MYGHLQRPSLYGPKKFKPFAAKPLAALPFATKFWQLAARPLAADHLQQVTCTKNWAFKAKPLAATTYSDNLQQKDHLQLRQLFYEIKYDNEIILQNLVKI